jgi:putative membrane-bound dehydrogenase-like protein
MAALRILLSLFFLCAALAAAEDRAIEVLFLGDDGAHQPIDRYAIFKEAAGNRGIHLTYEKHLSALTEEKLSDYDVLLVYAEHAALDDAGFRAMEAFVGNGGGLVSIHIPCFPGHAGYAALVGGRQESMGEALLTARTTAPDHPLVTGLAPFETWDETVRHRHLADDITVLQRIEDEPWTWVRSEGRGRVFHTAHGHDARCWRSAGFHELLERGIRWAAGEDAPRAVLPGLKYEVPMLPDRYRTAQPVPRIQSPLSPQDSMKRAQVPAGFDLSLYAAEPDIVNPIAITWDHLDRLWLVEALDYPNDLGRGNDRLKICEDTDGDGKADTFTVFADGLSIATSVVHANGGVLVTSGSQILFLQDTDGDDRADVRRVVIDGFKTHDTHAGVSNLRYGMDGWIYGTVGYAGYEGTVGGRALAFDTGVFRFPPDGSQLEFLGRTTNNTWGLGFTESGDVLGSTANRQGSWQVVGDGGPVNACDRGTRVFPITLDVQGSDGWDPPVELLGDGRIRANARHFTAAAGHGIYTAERFPAEWRNRTAFVCEPTAHLVAVARLRTQDADFIAEFDGNNLYASSDAWSAPVAAETGPDGAVWIADWYHIIVQHNRPGAPFEQTVVEKGKGAAYVTPLRDRQMGRIYRIFPKGSIHQPLPTQRLNAALAESSLVSRLHAQRLIGERHAAAMTSSLVAMAAEKHGTHALHALDGLGYFRDGDGKGPALLAEMMRHPDPRHRRAALSLWPAQLACAFDPVQEADPFVVREWLLLAARMPESEMLGRKLRAWHRDHPRLRRGVVLDRCFAAAAARHAGGFLLASLETPPDPAVLKDRIYPAAIRAFAASPSPALSRLLESDDSPLATAMKDALAARAIAKKHRPPADQLARGMALYAGHCASCHQTTGTGVEGAFPPLDGSPRVAGDASAAIRIVLHGLTGPVQVHGKPPINSLMPPVPGLQDGEIADLLTYIRHAWSNDAPIVSAAEVQAVRAAHQERQTPWTVEELR